VHGLSKFWGFRVRAGGIGILGTGPLAAVDDVNLAG